MTGSFAGKVITMKRERASLFRRREFLGALGATAGVAAMATGPVAAQTVATRAEHGQPPLKIIDFHNHYVDPSFTLTNTLAGEQFR